MNFAEQLSYWYLRLNGFFPISNFVLHRAADHPTSDADLIAVRFPFTNEDIGGAPNDWDVIFRNQFGIDLATETVGLLVEVKSGNWDMSDLTDQGAEWRMRDAIRRMGMLQPGDIAHALDQLRNNAMVRTEGYTIGKLFVGNGRLPAGSPWLHVELDHVDEFVCGRITNYPDRKNRDRLFFPGSLIQYLAWKHGRMR